MELNKSAIVLGVITAIPIPAVLVIFITAFVQGLSGIQISGTTGLILICLAVLGVFVHTIMFFYYMIKMQNLSSIKQDHYMLWLLIFMVIGGQLAFWYLYIWKTRHSS